MSTLTKEWLQQAINDYESVRDELHFGLDDYQGNILAALRIALASLESEAVGEVVLGEYDDCGCHPDARVVCIAADGQADWENFKDGTRLYAAPPSLVEIDEREAFNAWNNDENLPIAGVGAKNAAWLAWQARAAMLQSFGNTEQLIKHQSSNQGSDSNASWEEIKQPSSNCIPGVQAFIDAMIQDEDVSLTNEGEMLRFRRNSPVTPDCWCRTCRPVTMSDMRFVVCPECGNKRCPHANDHRNDCTGSNEPGQVGSAYPAEPQQEVQGE